MSIQLFLSERGGCPPNGLTEAPWARWWEAPRGKRHRVRVVVVSAVSRAVTNRGDKLSRAWEEKRGEVDPRAATDNALPHDVCTGPCSPVPAGSRVLQQENRENEGWFTMEHHGAPRCTMVDHGAPWRTMVHNGFRRFIFATQHPNRNFAKKVDQTFKKKC